MSMAKKITKEAGKALAFGRKGKLEQPATQPRSQVLPGHETVRDQTLDNLCESIGEHRAAKNLHTEHEQADIQAALTRMQEIGKRCVVYKHAGVELARVPGAEQLRVRLTKSTGDAGAAELVGPTE